MTANHSAAADQESLSKEVSDLERQLEDAKARLKAVQLRDGSFSSPPTRLTASSSPNHPDPTLGGLSSHFLFLLSDSALPLGSFAFSSGLESYLAHVRPPNFATFLNITLSSYASSALPYVLTAYRDPSRLVELDDALDAAIMCTVGRRASIAQGKALLSIWERSFLPTVLGSSITEADIAPIRELSAALKAPKTNEDDLPPPASAHLPPLFGAVSRVLGLAERQAAYVFLLGHVKAVLSAAVRASLFGPYHAQKVLASAMVRDEIEKVIDREWNTAVEDAGQCVPVLDLWMGRHEMLYSRIFNS